ncbi:MAG: lipopolysaccharide assembly protein LapB [Candidatus Competibacterales bacterium]|nr:lipopolysaccharide assembly protein LapB [Candidatus Competibacterales bacterium]
MLPALFWLLLPVAAASGWWLAWRQARRDSEAAADRNAYFLSLNYLLDDRPDQALEVFEHMASGDRDTVETQLMLGNLFRRRGEVDRAIHTHHALLTRNPLTPEQRQRVLLELAEDYTRAGLLDRAENLYLHLVEGPAQPDTLAAALNRLIGIYEQEKDWRQAITHCDLLERRTGQVRKIEAAQYCCELTQQALDQQEPEVAQSCLQEALQRNAACARANLLRARLALAADDRAGAIEALIAVEHQVPRLLSEVLAPLAECFEALNRMPDFLDWLHAVHERHRYGWLAASLAHHLARWQGIPQALDFLDRVLARQPSFIGLRTLLELELEREPQDGGHLSTLFRAGRRMLDGAARYRCGQCGLVSTTLMWQCPSCKHWETIAPLPDLICRSPT